MDARINHMLLATALLGTFFSGTATRIFHISMPTVAASLGTDLIGISWALLAYQLSNIGLSIIFGRVADLWGREKVFALGFVVLALASLLCGISQTVFQLILFRFVQGIGGAMIQSSSRALAAQSVPEDLGGRAQGYMTTAHHSGFLLGPSIGGLMIDYLSWRWTFFFLVPLGLFGALVTLGNLKNRPAESRRRQPVDYAGAALLFATTTTLVLILDRRTLAVMGAEAKIASLALFLACLGGLLFHEAKTKSPFINFTLLKNRIFGLSALSLLLVATCYAVIFFLLPFYLQDVLRLSPSFIGLLFMAPSITTVALAPVSGYLADRLGPRLPATLGVGCMVLALLLGVFLRADSHWLLPTAMVAFAAMTNGLFNPANSTAMITMTPHEHRGFASAVNHVTFGLGNILGVALGGFVMAAVFERHTGLSGVAPTTSHPEAFVAAIAATFLAAAGLSLVAVVTSAARGNGKRQTALAVES
jgi:EmrB/QacA subfamily drug resistance transporter